MDNAQTDKLEPCPFCGGEAALESPTCGYRVQCVERGCYTAGPWPDDCTEAEAIAAWNHRIQSLSAHPAGDVALREAATLIEDAAIDLWEQSPAFAKMDPWVRCEWSEISERGREIWRGKAVAQALATPAAPTTDAGALVEEPIAWLYASEDGSRELFLDCNHERARRLLEMGWTEQPLYAALRASTGTPAEDFQQGVDRWMDACFGNAIKADQVERADRFIEEALELAQTMPGFGADRAHALVDYVFNRDMGERAQEVGGVMVTLAALCNTVGIDMTEAGDTELARVWTKVEQIRAKQATKPTGSALPVALKDTQP